MPTYAFLAMLVSLRLDDEPIAYETPLGPPVRFHVSYIQKDISQPTFFSYSNLGPKYL